MVRHRDSIGPGRGRPGACDMHPSRGGRPRRVSIGQRSTDTRRGLPPEICWIILARGQSSTDLIMPERNRAFRCSVDPPGGPGAPEGIKGWLCLMCYVSKTKSGDDCSEGEYWHMANQPSVRHVRRDVCSAFLFCLLSSEQ